ncbi:hypothetical protein DM02DRAFT_128033 [Periconia macrospinosa]|uniref:Uncharacterized protein n=1 Tax=Periconia macrospinosa TaxID=97972 RepID=A0A2V1E4Y1_9PLEO|nr:hypothetical protein DM02DRAFT_128033 [Periconia macrospinosa]
MAYPAFSGIALAKEYFWIGAWSWILVLLGGNIFLFFPNIALLFMTAHFFAPPNNVRELVPYHICVVHHDICIIVDPLSLLIFEQTARIQTVPDRRNNSDIMESTLLYVGSGIILLQFFRCASPFPRSLLIVLHLVGCHIVKPI